MHRISGTENGWMDKHISFVSTQEILFKAIMRAVVVVYNTTILGKSMDIQASYWIKQLSNSAKIVD